MLELATILVIFAIVAVAVLSRSVTVMGFSVLVLTTIMAMFPTWYNILLVILGIFMISFSFYFRVR